MVLQVDAFLIDTDLPSFEWEQSQIIEHILISLGWFGLRLYQSPSSYDVNKNIVHLTDTPITNRMEED